MALYRPGECNIGSREINIRYQFGIVGFVLAVIEFALIVHYATPPVYNALIIVPLLLGFEGFKQGREKFCATYALLGLYDISKDGRKKGKVKSANAHSADIRKMLRIHVYSVALSLIITAFLFMAYSLYLSPL